MFVSNRTLAKLAAVVGTRCGLRYGFLRITPFLTFQNLLKLSRLEPTVGQR